MNKDKHGFSLFVAKKLYKKEKNNKNVKNKQRKKENK
jgi:hypothetical protein